MAASPSKVPNGTDNRETRYRSGPVSRTDWIDHCRACAHATFFHTPYWAELFAEGAPGNRFVNATRLLRFDDDTVVLVPLVYKRHLGGLLRIACSMPAGTFGGYCAPLPLSREKEQAVLAYLLRHPNCIFRENPYQPLRELPETVDGTDDPTQVVDLENGYDAAWKRATAAHRNAVRNAIKAGVEITEADNEDDWKTYVKVYEASINRWKSRNIYSGVAYDTDFFLRIARLDGSLRRLWLARVKGAPVAGILCFYWNRHAVVWHGSALDTHFSYHPNNLLYDRAMAHAAQAGYRWFDCNPSGSLKGVYKFKQYLGAQPLRSRVFVKRSPLLRLARVFRRKGTAA